MKSRIFIRIMLCVLIVMIAATMVACNKDSGTQSNNNSESSQGQNIEPRHVHAWDSGSVTTQPTFNKTGVRTFTCECGDTKTELIPRLIPTAQQIVDGRAAVKNATTQNYDFKLNFSGTVSVAGYSGTANGNYDGKYRYNKSSNELKFYRKTSGSLLYDAQEYIYTEGDSRLKIKMSDGGVAKSVSVIPAQDEELTMVNLPFVSLVDALETENVSNAVLNNDSTYSKFSFVTTLKLSSSNPIITKLLNLVGKLGMNITIKDVTFPNIQNGFKMYFNMSDDGKFKDFLLSAEISFPVKGIPTKLGIVYDQTASDATIKIPSVTNLITSDSAISSNLADINNAIASVKSSTAYSLDLTAVNDFDPGWSKLATVDKYIARMYKNGTDFNQSFKYKAHTEEEGKEAYNYTLGNVETDNKVYLISRKGTNTQTEKTGISAATQFDYLLAPVMLTANNVDCISKKTLDGGAIEYTVYVKDSSTTAMQQIIADLINSNEAVGVIPVNNYFDSSNYKVKESQFVYVVKSGALVSAKANIELKYTPTGGENTDSNITLKNSVELLVNEKIDKASEYEAPKDVDTHLGSLGLNNSKYYIL